MQANGVARGNTPNVPPPPEIGKNCCRKMMLFPMALFLAAKFPKLAKNSIFLLNFYQKFSQNFPKNCFSSKREKITKSFSNLVENRLK